MTSSQVAIVSVAVGPVGPLSNLPSLATAGLTSLGSDFVFDGGYSATGDRGRVQGHSAVLGRGGGGGLGPA